VPVEYESRPVRDGDVLAGAVVSFSDITERKKAEQTLRESEKKYRQVIESIGEGVGVADPEDRFVFANCAAGAIFGVEPERLVGQRLDAFVTPESWTRVREQTARRSKGESGSYEIEVVRPDGSRRTVLITATPQYDKAGAFTGAFGVFRDVTDLKRAEAEIAQKNAKLAELNEFKNQLLGMAAHDLRNPLSVIYAASSFLADPGAQSLPAEKRQDFLFRIKNNSEFMAQLIEDLLDFAAIESGKVSLSQKTTDLAEFVRRNVEQNRMLAERKGITVSYETGETLPPVAVDRFRIDRVLNNLIGNAVKFSATGSPVTVATRRNNGSIVVSVRDLGPGIPAEELDRLFKPFSRTSVKSTGGERGTGLGLAISKETVEAHGGRVWVESVVGRGSTFSFSLPVRDAV
jgi:PAS domain S-box-containing protein